MVNSEEILNKIRGIYALWRGRRYEQLAALFCSALLALFFYVSGGGEIPIIGHHAFILPAVLVMIFACLAFIIWRIGKLALTSTAEQAEKALSNSIRGPLPFVETDGELFLQLGRTRDVQNVLSYVTNKEIPLIVLSGESGAGKTSLLRAGLSHVLKGQYGRNCLYWDARPKDPEASLLHLLQEALGGAEKLLDLNSLYEDDFPDTGLVIIIDQFEQLNIENPENQGIFTLLHKASTRRPPHPITWVVAFKREYGSDWFEFQSNHGINPPHVAVKLLTEEQAEQVMVTLGATAGITFERLLLQDFIRSASISGKISPVDIGIGVLVLVNLATRENKETLRYGDYNFAGGSIGVMTAYLQDHISTFPDIWRQDLLKILLELFDHDKDQRIADGLTVTELSSKCNLSYAKLTNVMEQLANPNVRILEKMKVGSEFYFRLPHERLIPAIRQLSGSILAEGDRARLLLDNGYRTWSRSHSSSFFLSDRDLYFIRKHSLKGGEGLPAELSTYLKLSIRHRRSKRIAIYGIAVSCLISFFFLGLKADWKVTRVVTISPAGEFHPFLMRPTVDENKIITGFGSNQEVRIWSAHTSEVLEKIQGDSFLLSPNNRYLLIWDGKEKSIDMLDIATNVRRRTTFSSALKVESINFANAGEAIYYIDAYSNTSSLNNAGENFRGQNRIKIWSFDTGRETSFLLDNELPIPDISFLEIKDNRFIGEAHVGGKSGFAVWDTASGQSLGFLNHYGHTTSAFGIFEKYAVILEKFDEEKTAIELWNIESATLMRENLFLSKFDSISSIHPYFGWSGKIVYFTNLISPEKYQKAKLKPKTEIIAFDVSDLSQIGNADVEIKSSNSIDDFLIFPAKSNNLKIYGINTNFSASLNQIKFNEIREFILSKDLKSIFFLTKKGEVKLCAVDWNAPNCHVIIDNASSLFRIQGGDVFGVLTNVGSLSIFTYKGDRIQFLPTTGTFGDKFLVSVSPDCNEIFSWTEDGQVLQYKKQWVFFGVEI